MKKILAAVALAFCQVGAGQAATIGFDNLSTFATDLTGRTYQENGITATGNGEFFESYFRSADKLYLANSGWGGPTSVAFSLGSVFNAISFDLTPSVFDYFIRNTKNGTATPASYANVRVSGFNSSGLAAELVFNMGTSMTQTTYVLGNAFTNLTSLVFGFSDPFLGKVGRNKVAECSAPCSRYLIDNVTLAPVPLPAGMGLTLTALTATAFVTRRRRARGVPVL